MGNELHLQDLLQHELQIDMINTCNQDLSK